MDEMASAVLQTIGLRFFWRDPEEIMQQEAGT